MKRKLLPALIAVCTAMGATASDRVFDNPSNKAYFGARVSLDITSPGDFKEGDFSIKAFDPGFGFSAGAIYNIPVYKNLYFEPGLSLYYNTTLLDSHDDDIDGSLREFGFRIPFSIGYHFDLRPCKLFVFSGPELQIGLSGKEHVTVKEGRGKVSRSHDMYDDFNRTSLGLMLGGGVQIDNYYLSMTGVFDLTDRYKDDGSWRNNRFSLAVGYNF